MTRKDYKVIAKAITDAMDNTAQDAEPAVIWGTLVEVMADALQQDNPRFDAQKFYNAVQY